MKHPKDLSRSFRVRYIFSPSTFPLTTGACATNILEPGGRKEWQFNCFRRKRKICDHSCVWRIRSTKWHKKGTSLRITRLTYWMNKGDFGLLTTWNENNGYNLRFFNLPDSRFRARLFPLSSSLKSESESSVLTLPQPSSSSVDAVIPPAARWLPGTVDRCANT